MEDGDRETEDEADAGAEPFWRHVHGFGRQMQASGYLTFRDLAAEIAEGTAGGEAEAAEAEVYGQECCDEAAAGEYVY